MSHLNGGRMTTGRPLPRPLPPITDSLGTSGLKFGAQNSNYTSSSHNLNDNFGNRGGTTGVNNLNCHMFATTPRNLNMNTHR